MTKTNTLILFFITSLLIFLFIKVSPSFFPLLMPDSHDYLKINNSNTRTAIYPGLNQLASFLNIKIVEIQILVLSFSLASLIVALTYKTKSFYIYFVSLTILCSNYYYTSFSKTILAESFFFSFINVVISLLFVVNIKSKINLFILGIFCGLILTIKPIGLIITIPIVFYLILKNRASLINHSILISSIISIIILESMLFFTYHEKRSSVLSAAMSGKIFMISGYDGFDYEVFPEKFHPLLNEVEKESEKVNSFLNSIKNPLLKIDLTADYEAVFQTQLFNLIHINNDKVFKEFKNDKKNFYICMKNNFMSYLRLSFSHYIGQWLTGPKFIFLDNLRKNENRKIPFYKNLVLSSSDFDKPKKNILSISLLLFLLLFLIFTILSIFTAHRIFIKREFDFQCLLVTISQFYLIVTSLINISTIRYLMPVYPLIVITIILFLYTKFQVSFKKNNHIKEIIN